MCLMLGLCDTVQKIQPIIPECNVRYSTEDEDVTPFYDTHWKPLNQSGM